jgi:hypothetical protein
MPTRNPLFKEELEGMIRRFAKVKFAKPIGPIEFGISDPANPARGVLFVFARTPGRGPTGWAQIASLYSLDFASAYSMAVSLIRAFAGHRRRPGWFSRGTFRGKKPPAISKSSWRRRLGSENNPWVQSLAFPPPPKDCPF